MKPSSTEYDCIVIGGGPSGSTTAALVADAGYRVLLLERDAEPRRKVGESLMPETYWVFERLGVLDGSEERTVRPEGWRPVRQQQRQGVVAIFVHAARSARVWPHMACGAGQVRSVLARQRHEEGRRSSCRGARVCRGRYSKATAPSGVQISAGEAASAAAKSAIRAKVIVDATGQAGLLGARFALPKANPKFRKAAIWGHFRGSRRDVIDRRRDDRLPAHAVESLLVLAYSAVERRGQHRRGQATPIISSGPAPARRTRFSRTRSPIARRWPAARRRRKSRRPRCRERVLLHNRKHPSGDGWVLVGDSWGFIDPIYSSGVWFALKSGQLAADAIVEGLQNGDTTGEQLGKWVPDFARGTAWVRKLAEAWYCGQFRVGKFIREYPHHVGPMTDILIGRIFHPEAGRNVRRPRPVARTDENGRRDELNRKRASDLH